MADDRVVDLETSRKAGHVRYRGEEPKPATVTHVVPGRRSDNLTPAPGTRVTDALQALGFGRGIPHTEGSTRVGNKTLRELRDRCESAAIAAQETERRILDAFTLLEGALVMNTLGRTEADTLAKRLTEIIGDGPDEPKGAA